MVALAESTSTSLKILKTMNSVFFASNDIDAAHGEGVRQSSRRGSLAPALELRSPASVTASSISEAMNKLPGAYANLCDQLRSNPRNRVVVVSSVSLEALKAERIPTITAEGGRKIYPLSDALSGGDYSDISALEAAVSAHGGRLVLLTQEDSSDAILVLSVSERIRKKAA